METLRNHSMATCQRIGLLLLLQAILGCGPGTGQVSGTVVVGDSPLPGGIVTFLPETGSARSIELDEQGHFQLVLPVGRIAIAIDNRQFNPDRPKGPAGVPDMLPPDIKEKMNLDEREKPKPTGKPNRYVAIDPRYYRMETSGLSIQVKGGPQTEEIKLPGTDH